MESRTPNIAVRLELELLEDRVVPGLLVTTPVASVQSGDSYIPHLPRTGGIAVQTGSVLTIALAKEPAVNTLQITDDGKGDIQTSWDGGPIHSFTGIDHIIVESRGGDNTDVVTYALTGPLTGTQNVDIDLHARHDIVTAVLGSQGLATPGLTFSVAKRDQLTVVN